MSRYCDIKNGGDIFKAIASDTWSMFSNDYKNALLALIKPPPKARMLMEIECEAGFERGRCGQRRL